MDGGGLSRWLFDPQWWKAKTEAAEKLRVEKRLEEEWSHDPANLLGSRNPGRTLPRLVEIIHEDPGPQERVERAVR